MPYVSAIQRRMISSVAGDTEVGRGWPPRRENGRPPTAHTSGQDLRDDDRLKGTNDSLEGTVCHQQRMPTHGTSYAEISPPVIVEKSNASVLGVPIKSVH